LGSSGASASATWCSNLRPKRLRGVSAAQAGSEESEARVQQHGLELQLENTYPLNVDYVSNTDRVLEFDSDADGFRSKRRTSFTAER